MTNFDKKEINRRLKGVRGIGEVFNMINQGFSYEEVEAKIEELLILNEKSKPVFVDYKEPCEINIFGKPLINNNAIDDITEIASLPYVVGAALMPDAHRVKEGHAPVGSVILTDENLIVPDLVGADISCSVMLTTFKFPYKEEYRKQLAHFLRTRTYFGRAFNPDSTAIDTTNLLENFPVLISEVGNSIAQNIKAQARSQFGTCGDGNHFAVFGKRINNELALMTHFGSRGAGATIAKAFGNYANEKIKTPSGLNAPLNIETPEGKDYLALLQWAGDFAYESHLWIAKQTGFEFDKPIYSRHNFAWIYKNGGFLHRKGATPAQYAYYGVIPASMLEGSAIIVGLGNEDSFYSASHGAGRTHARGRAIQEFSNSFDAEIKKSDITVIGGGADEDSRAYKNLKTVMKHQDSCCEVVDWFQPIVVRMADPRL